MLDKVTGMITISGTGAMRDYADALQMLDKIEATQIKAADVNTDDTAIASDAAIILIYAAAVRAGNMDVKITFFAIKR